MEDSVPGPLGTLRRPRGEGQGLGGCQGERSFACCSTGGLCLYDPGIPLHPTMSRATNRANNVAFIPHPNTSAVPSQGLRDAEQLASFVVAAVDEWLDEDVIGLSRTRFSHSPQASRISRASPLDYTPLSVYGHSEPDSLIVSILHQKVLLYF